MKSEEYYLQSCEPVQCGRRLPTALSPVQVGTVRQATTTTKSRVYGVIPEDRFLYDHGKRQILRFTCIKSN
jgi:hypothetical protein